MVAVIAVVTMVTIITMLAVVSVVTVFSVAMVAMVTGIIVSGGGKCTPGAVEWRCRTDGYKLEVAYQERRAKPSTYTGGVAS